MLNTLSIFHELQETLDSRAAEKIAEIIGRVYEELQNTVTKEEFRELTDIVRDLGDAQKRTETRVEELAEAQKRTEACVEELAEAQKRTEARVEELAEAQKRTETRVEELAEAQKELAEAQKRTEARVEELAEAQKALTDAQAKTEYVLQHVVQKQEDLSRELHNTKKLVGELSDTVGYGLEDRAYQFWPHLLKQDFGIETEGPLHRRYLPDKTGKMLEVNLFCAATQTGKPIHVIGEAKSQLSKRSIDEFRRKKLKRLEGVYPSLFPLLITYMISSPDVAEYAEQHGIHVYYSYQFVGS